MDWEAVRATAVVVFLAFVLALILANVAARPR